MKMIRIVLFLGFLFSSFAVFAQPRLRTIVVDAGHGGQDVGARGAYSTEKEITLAIALKLEQELKRQLPEVNIIMTRTTDVYQSPSEKADFANKAKGDLFLCIHVNSAAPIKEVKRVGTRTETYYTGKGKKRKKNTRQVPVYKTYYYPNPAKGTETYIWAADRTDEKGAAVQDEGKYGESEADSTGIPDLNSPEAKIMSQLWVKQFFAKSYKLATMVEEEFTNIGRVSRGVKQRNEKGIWVLQATAMPSILVETGYIQNAEEESYLTSEEGQWEITRAIVKAVMRYKTPSGANTGR